MSDGYRDPLAPDADAHNPFAAPEVQGEVATSSSDLATRGSRFTGAFVDGLTFLPVAFGVLFVTMQMASTNPSLFTEGGIGTNLVIGAITAVLYTVWFVLVHGYTLANRGQTLGKMAAGTKIVNADTGELVPLGTIVVRRWLSIQLIALIPVVGGIIGLINILLIFRESRQCLHDNFANTKVIQVKSS